MVYLFKPSNDVPTQVVRFKGVDAQQRYRLRFADDSHPASIKTGAELMAPGLSVTLDGAEVSELVFFEIAR